MCTVPAFFRKNKFKIYKPWHVFIPGAAQESSNVQPIGGFKASTLKQLALSTKKVVSLSSIFFLNLTLKLRTDHRKALREETK